MDTQQSDIPVYYIGTKVHPDRLKSYAKDANQRLEGLGIRAKVRRVFASLTLSDIPPSGFPTGVSYQDLSNELENITQVCQELEPSELQRQYLLSSISKLISNAQDGHQVLKAHQQANQSIIDGGRVDLLKFIDTQWHEAGKGLVPFYTQDVVTETMKAIIDSAPMWLKFQLKSANVVKNMLASAASLKKLIKWKKMVGDATIKDSDQIKTMKPEQFSGWILGKPWLPIETSEETLISIWNSSANDIAHDGIIDNQAMRLDLVKKMEAVWKKVPLRKKLLPVVGLPLVLAGALASVLLIPFDGGGSTIIMAATLKELLIAGGVGGLLGSALSTRAGATLNQSVEEHAARPQHSALFAILQDRLGIPRATTKELKKISANKAIQLTSSNYPSRTQVLQSLTPPVTSVNEQVLEDILKQLAQLPHEI